MEARGLGRRGAGPVAPRVTRLLGGPSPGGAGPHARPGGSRGPSSGTELRVPGRARAGASAERAPRGGFPRPAGQELRRPRGTTWRPLPLGLGRGLRLDWRRGGPEPRAAGCGHRTRRQPRRGGRGPQGSPRVPSGTGRSNFPEYGMRLPAPPGGRAAAPFHGGSSRNRHEGAGPGQGWGHPGSCLASLSRAHD